VAICPPNNYWGFARAHPGSADLLNSQIRVYSSHRWSVWLLHFAAALTCRSPDQRSFLCQGILPGAHAFASL